MPARNRVNARAATRPPIVVALCLLGGATALAALVVRARSAVELADSVAPRGWHVSFRGPAGWEATTLEDDASERIVALHETGDPRSRRILLVGQYPSPQEQSLPQLVEMLRLRWAYPSLGRFIAGAPDRVFEAPIGRFSGAALEDDARGAVILAVRIDSHVVAVGIIGGSSPVGDRDRRLAEAVVKSVEPIEAPH